jgi:hypothetical protein
MACGPGRFLNGGLAMAFLILLAAVFFLLASVALFWLSRFIDAGLLDDAVLSLGFSLTAFDLSQVIAGGLARSLPVLALLLAVR